MPFSPRSNDSNLVDMFCAAYSSIPSILPLPLLLTLRSLVDQSHSDERERKYDEARRDVENEERTLEQ